jgi:hypothetical protein
VGAVAAHPTMKLSMNWSCKLGLEAWRGRNRGGGEDRTGGRGCG